MAVSPFSRGVRRGGRGTLARTAVVTVVVGGLLAAAAACGGSSGGGSSSSTPGPVTITVSHGYTDVEATEIKAQAEQWNTANPTQKVNLVFNGGNDSALQKTIAGFTAGNFPDVAYEYGSSAAQLARQPKLVDLTDKVKAPAFDWNDFYPSERQAATVNGKVVGIPALVDNLALVYNKKMFAAAGVPVPTDSWTWQDFRDAAKKLSNPSTHTYGWAYVNDASEDTVWRYLAMLWQAGGDLLTPDNRAPAFDSPAGMAALQQLQDMAVTDKSVYLDTGNGNYLNLFNSGKVAMLWTGPWDLSSINSDVSYGVTLLPGYNGNHETISGPDLYMLFDHSSDRSAAAFNFTSWLTSAKVHLEFAIATGDLPVRKSETTLPDYQTFLKKFPSEAVFVDNLNNVKHVRPNIPDYAEVSTAIGQMVQSVLLGRAQPAAALKTANDAVKSALAGSCSSVRQDESRGPSARRRSRPRTILPRDPHPAGARRPKRTRGQRQDALTGLAMVSPAAILIGVFGLIPVIWSFWLSFQRNDLQTPGEWVGLKNYHQLTQDPLFWSSVRHTVVYTVLFVPITLVLSLLAAAALNRRIRGITIYRLAVFIPVVTSTIATGVIFTWLMDPDFGLINAALHRFGLPTFQFFASPTQALPAVVIMTVWGWVGFGALIFLAGLQGIPQDLLDAAQTDGCSKRQAFWRIQVPLLRPVSGFLLVWLTINALQLFDEVYATTKGGPAQATTVVVYYLYQQAFQYFHAGYAAAIAVVLFAAIALITLVQMRLTREPLAAGEVRR